MKMMMWPLSLLLVVDELIHITEKQLDSQVVIDLVTSPEAGAINVFIGTVRNSTQNKSVQRLELRVAELESKNIFLYSPLLK